MPYRVPLPHDGRWREILNTDAHDYWGSGLGNLGGVVSVNDDTQIVNVPNPLLKPEHSTKYFASLQYYLEPSGIIGLSYYRLDMKDMQ
ncbi:hypothetical protein LTR94_037716, partial [Friedmanniomyces endolithicus]